MNENANKINNALSLRTPQAEALEILTKIVGTITLTKTPDNASALLAIKGLGFPIKDFERDFPSICFSVATGVGKTRLMGAFITYLYLEKNVKNFFIVAPNLTIYNKLIADFRDISSPKYVFQGIPEFAQKRPVIITGDDYMDMGGLTSRMYEDRIKVNIFNISKINRDKDAKGTPKFRSFRETLGSSYFDYLQSLPDLVLLMDEAHRYRATAGMKIINELQAILGLELTATAHDEKGKQFANVVYHYALAQAVTDKYVKKPAIVGRTNFDKTAYDAEKLEEIKLVDGFKVHEDTKAVLEVYASSHNARLVKPFLLVVARDTIHANILKEKIDSDLWQDGKYKNKVLVIHSNQKGSELDENVALLLEVEKATNPIEVVIHVNMLAEGWDVNNLYTIVPLRAADSKTLVEQSIGRGLRLPYGKHTGVDSIDRLNIVAHDKFAEIVKIAEQEGFQFQKIELKNDNDAGTKVAVDNPSSFMADILAGRTYSPSSSTPATAQGKLILEKPNAVDIAMAIKVAEHIEEKIKTIGSLEEIKSASSVAEIVEEIHQAETEGKLDFREDTTKLKAMVEKLTTQFVERQIQIPPIRIVRVAPKIGVEYKRFPLNLAPFSELKPVKQNILVREIMENKRIEQGEAVFTKQYKRLADYIIIKLMDDMPCISSEDIDLLEYMANQVVEHIKTYAIGDEVEKILFFNNERIAKDILTQSEKHKSIPTIETKVKGFEDGYICLRTRPAKLLGDKSEGEQSFRNRPKILSKIKSIIFINFTKCLSQKVKFDSDTERQLSVLLEDTAIVERWERLSDDQAIDAFNLRYKKESGGLSSYCPDFVVETTDAKYIVETKAADNMTVADVVAKKEIAARWCNEASKYEQIVGGKPWAYLLIPHNDLDPTRTFEKLVADWSVK